jgi:serine O-acetyltransferase
MRKALHQEPEQSSGRRPGLLELIRGDVAGWYSFLPPGSEPRGAVAELLAAIRLIMLYSGLRATVLYRISHELNQRNVKLIPHVLFQVNMILHGLDIPPSVPVGARLFIPHPVGTVVMAERIGDDVTLVSSVTIGLRKGHAFPRIGSHVYIGAGARVVGDIRVGNRVSIGANAVVLADVPDDSVAVGVPARIRPAAAERQPASRHA